MLILGIETSCDETAAAIVADGRDVLSNEIASSKESFRDLAGVIPEEAAREQVRCIVPVVTQALTAASVTWADIDAIAVTRGPGLLGSLLVGTVAARTLASIYQKRLIGVHHILGHLSSVSLGCRGPIYFPALALSVSGGHTELWLRTSHTTGTLLGRTRDDAAGEAFDKGASLLGLPYPGGPVLAEHAKAGDRSAFAFPLPLKEDPTLDFSFSGLKTSLRYIIRDDQSVLARINDLAASYEASIVAHLLDRIERAHTLHSDIQELHVVGGVSANESLCEAVRMYAKRNALTARFPLERSYCTDNAAMLAAAGHFLLLEQPENGTQEFETAATLELEEALSLPGTLGAMPKE